MTENPLVTDYLRRLDAAAQVLPQRSELVAEIRAHIAEGLYGAGDQASVRNVLQRLGSPEEIVAAARDDVPPPPCGAPPPASWPAGYGRPAAAGRPAGPGGLGLAEIGAVLMLSVGSVVLPGIGWLIGVILLWTSPVWKVWEKALATLVLPGSIGVFLLYPMLPLSAPQLLPVHSLVAVPVVMLLATLAVPAFLLVVARRRVRAGDRTGRVPYVASGTVA